MLLLGSKVNEQAVWTATAEICADVDEVLEALTDPEVISAWAPVRFEVEGLAGGRLRAGARERVSGAIAGVKVTFDVDVSRADEDGLELVAHGPLSFDVAYDLCPSAFGVAVQASVSLRRPRGWSGQLLQAAVCALLNAGALGAALLRLQAALCEPLDARLMAA